MRVRIIETRISRNEQTDEKRKREKNEEHKLMSWKFEFAFSRVAGRRTISCMFPKRRRSFCFWKICFDWLVTHIFLFTLHQEEEGNIHVRGDTRGKGIGKNGSVRGK